MSRSFKDWRPYFFILLIAAMVYWPLTFGIFSLKNDALIYFLPWRFHISEALQSGHMPYWTPYLYTGFPLSADMQSGAWNPVVLFISLFTRYNMQVLQWELLFYLFIAGVGMYKLIREFGYKTQTALLAGITYMCCGFMTDSGSFIPWITSAAWLPFVFVYSHRLLKAPSFTVSIKLGLFLFLLFTAGYPAFFIYTIYILAAAFIISLIRNRRDKLVFKTAKFGLISLLVFGLLSAPAIISFLEFLPYYQRGSGTTLTAAQTNPFPPFATISWLLPQAVAKPHEWIQTDLAMRNGYTGIFTLLFFALALTRKLNFFQKLILGITIFSFLFSLGDATPLRRWCYLFLPGMDSFRHPGVIRLFTTIGIIILAAGMIQEYLEDIINRKKIKIAAAVIAGLVFCFVVYYLFNGGIEFSRGMHLKESLDKLSFANLAVITGIIQIFFLGIFYYFNKNKKVSTWLIGLNSILFAMMALPFTFVSQTKTKEIDQSLNRVPKGFQNPAKGDSIAAATKIDSVNTHYGFAEFYNKKIIIQGNIVSPTINKDYLKFLSDSSLRKQLDKFPPAYTIPNTGTTDSIKEEFIQWRGSNEFNLSVEVPDKSELVIFQQYNPGWHAWANKSTLRIEKAHTAFMKVTLPQGRSSVRFWLEPGGSYFPISIIVSALTLLFAIVYLGWKSWRKRIK